MKMEILINEDKITMNVEVGMKTIVFIK